MNTYFKIRVHVANKLSPSPQDMSQYTYFNVTFSGVSPFDMDVYTKKKAEFDGKGAKIAHAIDVELLARLKDRFNVPHLLPNQGVVSKVKTISNKVDINCPSIDPIVSDIKNAIIKELDETKAYLTHISVQNRSWDNNTCVQTALLHTIVYYSNADASSEQQQQQQQQ